MNKSILVFTFVSLLGSNAIANDATSSNNAVLLTTENATAFQSFISREVPMFYQINSDAWKHFNKVVTYYNHSTSKLLKMNQVDRTSFLIAAAQIQQELKIMNARDSKKWIDLVRTTTAVVKLTWDNQQVIEVKFEQPPVMKQSMPAMSSNFIGE